jgi:RNA polymerase sigma factor (sigma-70 family)
VAASSAHAAIDAVWRIESAKVIASLTRLVGDLGLAEELAQDALVAALEQWPDPGVPRNPGAWLMATAKHRAINEFRRRERLDRKLNELRHHLAAHGEGPVPDFDAAFADDIGDDVLRLIFTARHPVLPAESRVALTLRLLGGLRTGEIARAFLVPESTVAQRIVRTKRTLAQARVPLEVPQGDERAARMSSVLEVLYLIFNPEILARLTADSPRGLLNVVEELLGDVGVALAALCDRLNTGAGFRGSGLTARVSCTVAADDARAGCHGLAGGVGSSAC